MPEPIFWAHHGPRARSQKAVAYNPETKEVEELFDPETGKQLFERIPQRGHVGGNYDKPELAKAARWMHVLRDDGHAVRIPLTGAAADMDTDAPQGRSLRAKARHFGWIRFGTCPLVEVMSGEIKAGQLVSKELRAQAKSGQGACPPGTCGPSKPCDHFRLEQAARMELRRKEAARIEHNHRSDADRLIESQGTQTKDIVTGVAQTIAAALVEAKKVK